VILFKVDAELGTAKKNYLIYEDLFISTSKFENYRQVEADA
jgi:hypothetical protein